MALGRLTHRPPHGLDAFSGKDCSTDPQERGSRLVAFFVAVHLCCMRFRSALLLVIVFSAHILSSCNSGDGWTYCEASAAADELLDPLCPESRAVRAKGERDPRREQQFRAQYQTTSDPYTWIDAELSIMIYDWTKDGRRTTFFRFTDVRGCSYKVHCDYFEIEFE